MGKARSSLWASGSSQHPRQELPMVLSHWKRAVFLVLSQSWRAGVRATTRSGFVTDT